jgi:hypothetical protein
MLNDELTTKLSKIQGKKSVEYGKILDEVRAKMERLVTEMVEQKPELREELPGLFGVDFAVDRMWVWVAHWWQHNNTAIKLDKNQVWLVG